MTPARWRWIASWNLSGWARNITICGVPAGPEQIHHDRKAVHIPEVTPGEQRQGRQDFEELLEHVPDRSRLDLRCGECNLDQGVPRPLRFQNQLDDFTDSPTASRRFGHHMNCLLDLDNCVSRTGSQTGDHERRQVRQVISHEADLAWGQLKCVDQLTK